MTTLSPGIDLDVSARICASLDGVAVRMDRENAWRQKIAGTLSQVYFAGQVTISGGAGTSAGDRDKLQAKPGYIWGVRRLTVQGFSAGSVTAYRNDINGEPVMPFPSPAVNTIGRGELLLMPMDTIVWSATGITGTVTYWGVADCFESWYLPFYLS